MKCSECGYQNRDAAKFCLECGEKLETLCPSCSKKLPPSAKFCDECGHRLQSDAVVKTDYQEPKSYTPKHLADKILTSRSTIEGERKLVTILFADIANFTSMSEQIDPEEVHQIMDGCFKILMDAIHKYEGTVNQFTGDGVMALFGAPISHEDHAQRACKAAIEIQSNLVGYCETIDREFKMRIGINSGYVVVGSIGDDLRMDYTAVGDTTNLAARIQQAAIPGKIWLSSETNSAIRGFFQVEEIGNHKFKGKSDKQSIYSIVAEHKDIRTRFEAGLRKGITGLVGRKPEMQIIKAEWERAKNSKARIVDVVGEAGVGKSRLIYEFQKEVEEEAAFLTGICLHYGRNINFLPLKDIVRSVFNINEGMREEEARHRIKERAKGDLSKMIPFYQNLLSLKVDDEGFNSLNPEGRKFGTFEAVKKLLWSVSESKPMVIFIEDVHWIDKISEEFFVFLSHSIKDKTILMLSAYRPEGSPGWAKGPYYRHLGVEPLSEKSSGHLVRNILSGVELDPNLEKLIMAKTGGNPFFVEEMVRELIERDELIKERKCYKLRNPIDNLDIPGTVQGIIAARMDRLSDDLKKTMQVASVIGRDFAYKILRSILELGDGLRNSLTNLVGLEVLYEKALYPELEYIFRHALTQEVAYESLLKQRRREIHGRIANAIEELYSDKLEQHYELLAHHWELSENPERAIKYLVLAGEKSNKAMAANTAVTFFNKAIKLLQNAKTPQDTTLELNIKIERARSFHILGEIDNSIKDFEEAISLSNELGNQETSFKILCELPFVIYNTSYKDKVPHYCGQAMHLAKSLDVTGAEAPIMAIHSYWRYVWENTDEVKAIENALATAKNTGQIKAIVQCSFFLSLFERWGGNPKKSLKYTEGLPELLQSVYNLGLACVVSFTRAWALIDTGKYNEAIVSLYNLLESVEQNNLNLILGRIYNSIGWGLSETYSLDKAIDFNEKSLKHSIGLLEQPTLIYSGSEQQAMAEVNIMENKFEMGNIDEAWNHILQFEERSGHSNYDIQRVRWSTRMKDLKGKIFLKRGDLDNAELMANQCIEAAKKRGIKKYIGKANRLQGKIFTERGQYDQSEIRLRKAIDILDEIENPKQLWMTHKALAKLYRKMKRSGLEREQWQIAFDIVNNTSDGLQDKNIKETFINATQVKKILKNANK